MLDVVILTDERFVNSENSGNHFDNVAKEDGLVLECLEKVGLKTERIAWSDASFDWTKTKSVLFRTTWDYAEKFTEFSDWLMDVSTKTRLINDYETIVWNLDKHYLNDLKEAGLNIVETCFLEPKDLRTLRKIHQELGWEHTVLKPAISASAKDTYKLTPENLSDHEDRYATLISDEAMMLQPFQKSILDRGEISLIMIGKAYTHAVLKVAKAGDFRVQDDFGGTVEDYIPTQEEIALAKAAVDACEVTPTYARVDIVNDNNGKPAISELELIEPELWFRKNEKAALMLAENIKKLLD